MRGRAAVLVILAVLCGCEDDDVTQGGGPNPTLDNAWPNENGRSWTYEMTAREWGTLPEVTYSDPDSVPPAPPITAILGLLDDRHTSVPPDTTLWAYGLQFSDSITTEPGVTVQHLAETLEPGAPVAGRFPATQVAPGQGFFRSLQRARPDLMPRLESLMGVAQDTIFVPLLLSGGAWEKTEDHIGLYGVLDTLLAWKYLEANLQPGHTFTHQLVPSLADDVFLQGRVVGTGNVETPVGVFAHAVEVAYLIDYGVTQVNPEPGGPEEYARFITYGAVTYAPTLGPVRMYERELVTVGDTLSEGVEDYELVLTAVKAGRQDQAP